MHSFAADCVSVPWLRAHLTQPIQPTLVALWRPSLARLAPVVDDQVGSPTATLEVSNAVCELLKSKPEGLFHFAADGYVSRYDMARFIVDKLSMDIDVAPCKTSDFPSPAIRPLNSRFDCSKISRLLSEPIEHWQKPLERFLGQL